MLDQSYYDKADEIVASHGAYQESLIPIIQDIQSEYRYLPPELLSYVAEKIGISEAKAYSVATFYENFSFEPKGKYVIKVCNGTACHVRKSIPILERLYSELGISGEKNTTFISPRSSEALFILVPSIAMPLVLFFRRCISILISSPSFSK
jgi:NADH-quinone oxidoreductase subunit E